MTPALPRSAMVTGGVARLEGATSARPRQCSRAVTPSRRAGGCAQAVLLGGGHISNGDAVPTISTGQLATAVAPALVAEAKASLERAEKESPYEAEAILQTKLLTGARGVFQMTRICFGPLLVDMARDYAYTAEEKGIILSAFAAGYCLTQIVGGLAADKYGGRPVILFGLCTSAVALLVLPVAAEAGIAQTYWLLWLMGLTQGPTYPAQLVTTAKWTTGSLRSYASALGAAGSTLGSLFALGLTPVLASRVGWRLTAMFMGMCTLLFAVIWYLLGRSSPPTARTSEVGATMDRAANASHPKETGKARSFFRKLLTYATVLTAPSVIAVVLAHTVCNFVRYFLMGWMPTYFNSVLKSSPDEAAMFMLIPEVIGLAVSFASANLGRRLQRTGALPALSSRRIFATTSYLAAAAGLWGLSFASTPVQATLCMCVVQGFATLQGLGFGANYLDVSKYNSGLVTGVGNTLATGGSWIAPMFAAWILSASGGEGMNLDDWRQLFLAFSASNLVGIAIFVPFCSVTPVDLHLETTPKSD